MFKIQSRKTIITTLYNAVNVYVFLKLIALNVIKNKLIS